MSPNLSRSRPCSTVVTSSFLEVRELSELLVGVAAALKSEMVGSWPDAIAGLGLDDLLSDHVTLSAEEMTIISQQIQLRMQQTQVQVSHVTFSTESRY